MPVQRTLTYEQKMKLINDGYVSARAFGSQNFEGWYKDWITYYDWILDNKLNRYNKISLYLLDRTRGFKRYEVYVSPKALNVLK